MIRMFQSQLEILNKLNGSSDAFNYSMSVLRSIFQVASISSIEIICQNPFLPNRELILNKYSKAFERPSDGLTINILNDIVPIIRTQLLREYYQGWFEPTSENKIPLERKAIEWVEFRNKKTGHGVVCKKDIDEWTPKLKKLIDECISCFKNFPEINNQGFLEIRALDLKIKTNLVYENSAIVISNIEERKGLFIVKAQTLSWEDSKNISIPLNKGSPFEDQFQLGSEIFKLIEVNVAGEKHSIWSNLPIRQTATFEGRTEELSKLSSWINDPDAPRFCLVFGDGGVGKTTLTLEFLNRILDGEENLSRRYPCIINYYSAKKTCWTDSGIMQIQGMSIAMEECVRELALLVHEVIPKEFYSSTRNNLVDKMAQEMIAQGFSRDDILLVIDNTETLVNSNENLTEFHEFIKYIGKRLARVILTSRRREFIPAEPIMISALSEQECLSLMRKLAQEHDAVAIKQCGESRLRNISIQLGGKPLLIDILIKYLGRSKNTGIDQALEIIFRKNNDDLLNFLYEDAWQRLNDLQREVFLVLASATVPLDSACVADACSFVKIQHIEFQSAFDETYFATLTDYGNLYEVQFADLAVRFFSRKMSELNSDQQRKISNFSNRVDDRARERNDIEVSYREDRVSDAFRNIYAKSAKIFVDKGDYENAEINFQLALMEDNMNSALHDRFAWFLLNKKQNPSEAKPLAEKAVSLNRSSADAALTLALCCYRLGDLNEGDKYIELAKNNGKAEAVCLLQQGIARYHKAKKLNDPLLSLNILKDSYEKIKAAKRLIGDSLVTHKAKNMNEAMRYEESILKFQNILKRRI